MNKAGMKIRPEPMADRHGTCRNGGGIGRAGGFPRPDCSVHWALTKDALLPILHSILPTSNRRKNGEEAVHFMQRLFLKLGDQVIHLRYPQWGIGVVVEQRSSTMAGGMCIARVVFRDGVERSFFNDLDNSNCCYFTGIRLQEDSESIHR